MARRIKHRALPGFVFSEFLMQPNEVLVFALRRSVSKNGDSALAFASPTGFSFALAIEHPDVVRTFIAPGGVAQEYISTVTGDYPARSDTAAISTYWTPALVSTGSILHTHDHGTALKITASPAGGRVIVYGDY